MVDRRVMTIGRASALDLDEIDEIERHSFPTPWPRATFAAELERACARIIVARDARSAIVGFCNYWLVVGEIHILAIATHPDRRRTGIAGRLLAHALADGRATQCGLATLEVRRSNLPAIALYERAGFRTVHIRKQYYQADGEDALVMVADQSDPGSPAR